MPPDTYNSLVFTNCWQIEPSSTIYIEQRFVDVAGVLQYCESEINFFSDPDPTFQEASYPDPTQDPT